MSKHKARIDSAVACDLGLVLSTHTTTVREIAENPDNVMCLVYAYELGELVCYDLIPLWREINGMRIKLPKFQSHPVISDRLHKQFYKRYYVGGVNGLVPIKVKTTAEFERRLPFELGNIIHYTTTIISPELIMGLRRKPLMFHRTSIGYESREHRSAAKTLDLLDA